MFEKSFSPLYCQDNGRPAKHISLLPILLWHGFLLDQGSMFADRTCRIQTSYRREGHRAYPERKYPHQPCSGGSEEGGRNVTFPTDSKLLNKIIRFCHKVAQTENLKIRQSYVHVIKELKLVQRFRGRKNCAAKVKKADKKMRAIAGRRLALNL